MTPAIYSQQQLTWWSLQISHHMPWVYNFLYHFHPKVKKITTCKCKTYFTWIQTKIETYLITWDKSRFNSIFKIFKYAIWRKKMKNKLCHDIVETMLKLALNANQSINQSDGIHLGSCQVTFPFTQLWPSNQLQDR